MAEYDTNETAKFVYGQKLKSPLLHDADFDFYWNGTDFNAALLKKLNDSCFDVIRKTKEFQAIIKMADAL